MLEIILDLEKKKSNRLPATKYQTHVMRYHNDSLCLFAQVSSWVIKNIVQHSTYEQI